MLLFNFRFISSSRNKFSFLDSNWVYFSFPVGSDYSLCLSHFREKLSSNHSYFLFVKVDLGNNEWITLDKLLIVNPGGITDPLYLKLLNIIHLGLNKFSNSYDIRAVVHNIVLCYSVISPGLNLPRPQLFNPSDSNIREFAKIRSEFLSEKYFPFSIDPDKFGKFLSRSHGPVPLLPGAAPDPFVTHTDTFLYSPDVLLKRHFFSANSSNTAVYVLDQYLFSFSDFKINDSLFRRSIDNLNLYFRNDLRKHLYSEINVDFKKIPKLQLTSKFDSKFLTLDIETYLDDSNNHIPYTIGFYDGLNSSTFYLTDFSSPEDLLFHCFKLLLVPKYRNKVVYVHNLARFDSLFIVKYLNKYFKIKPVLKDNKIYSLSLRTRPATIKLGGLPRNNVTIYLNDSFLMLPLPLRTLCQEFDVKSKGYFPYSFVKSNNLNYIGKTPAISYYNVPLKLYDELYRDQWNLREESQRYLINDLQSLYQVINSFSDRIFADYALDLKNYLTLPSLAFAIFRSNFFDNAVNKLAIINKNSRFKFIEESYFGGSVDIIKPKFENLYCYDVNSLYPSVLLNTMPVGDGVYSTDPNLDNWFGFIKVEVTCPDNLKVPLLPFRKDDGTVIHPVGSWTGTYFSEELKNAVKFGYSFKIIEGLKFQKGDNIFNDYVHHFFKLKNGDNKLDKKLGKLLLNSLYGRFGMKNLDVTTSIVTHDQAQYILANYDVFEHSDDIGDGFEIIKHSKILKNSRNYIDDNTFTLNGNQNIYSINSSIIASAITSYGRIYMSQFKNMKDNSLLYTDTDSLFMENPLPDELVGPNLGQFKLEHVCKAYWAINPKVYLLLTKDDNIIHKTAGFNFKLSVKECEALLNYNSLPLRFLSEKWKFKLAAGTLNITTINQLLYPQHSKRIPVYNSKGVWYDTKPFKLVNGSIVNFLPVLYQSPP